MPLPIRPLKPRGRPPKPGTPKHKEWMERQALARGEHVTVVPVVKETDEEIIKRVTDRFKVLEQITKSAIVGGARAIIVSGSGGVGKTHTITQIMDWAKEKHGIRYAIDHGCISPVNLYARLYEYRGPKDILVLDDSDGVFSDDASLTLLKAAMDTTDIRTISYRKNSKFLKDEGIPNEFKFNGTLIFITNINMQQIVDSGSSKTTEHLQALMTRALYLDLKLHTNRELVTWINYIVRKAGILVQKGLTKEQQDVVLKYLTEDREDFRNLSIRTAVHVAGLMLGNPKDWKVAADVLMKR